MKRIFREMGFIEMGELPKVEFYNNLILRSHAALILSLVAIGLLIVTLLSCEKHDKWQSEKRQEKIDRQLKQDEMDDCFNELFSKYLKEAVANSPVITYRECTQDMKAYAMKRANRECRLKL